MSFYKKSRFERVCDTRPALQSRVDRDTRSPNRQWRKRPPPTRCSRYIYTYIIAAAQLTACVPPHSCGPYPMAASTAADELQLKFLFANQDGVHLQLGFPKTATVAQVKTQLMRSWPQSTWPEKAVRPRDSRECSPLIFVRCFRCTAGRRSKSCATHLHGTRDPARRARGGGCCPGL